MTIDIEEVPAASQKNLLLFVDEMHGEFQKHGLKIAQAVPFDNRTGTTRPTPTSLIT